MHCLQGTGWLASPTPAQGVNRSVYLWGANRQAGTVDVLRCEKSMTRNAPDRNSEGKQRRYNPSNGRRCALGNAKIGGVLERVGLRTHNEDADAACHAARHAASNRTLLSSELHSV